VSDKNRNLLTTAAAFGTFAIFYVTIIAYSYATLYNSGYLAAFGVPIQSANYFPSIYDLTIKSFPIVASVIVLAISPIAMMIIFKFFRRLLNWIEKDITNKFFKKVVRLLSLYYSVSRIEAIILIALLLLVLPAYIVLNDAAKSGLAAASRQRSFYELVGPLSQSCVSDSSKGHICLVVFSSGSTVVVKPYDTLEKQFDKGFSTVPQDSVSMKAYDQQVIPMNN
jgi:hypothetical protein